MKSLKEFFKFIERNFSTLIGLIGVCIFFVISNNNGISINESKNFDSLLSADIGAVAMIIGLFGVLFTSLVTLKNTSSVIRYFLDSVDKRYFIKAIKKCILVGLINIVISAVLMIYDILLTELVMVLIYIWLYTVFLFMADTYKFISILIELITDDRIIETKEKDNQVITGEKEELIEKIMNTRNNEKP